MRNFRLRDVTPHGLYARSLALIISPIFLILTLTIWYYYVDHIAEMNRKLSQSVGRDIAALSNSCGDEKDTESLSQSLGINFHCDAPGDLLPSSEANKFPYSRIVVTEISNSLKVPVRVYLNKAESSFTIIFSRDGAESASAATIERKRAVIVNSHFLIVWLMIATLFPTLLAIAFLNQQVNSILRLSEAARAFGRGREMPDFRPAGATEVRDAARAVIDMKNRLTAFTEQRTAMLAGVSHDLRTPLTRLKLSLAMMDETEDIRAAKQDLNDMSMMLDEYLTFAKGEEGDDMRETDIAALVREVAQSFGTHLTVTGPTTLIVPARPLAIKRAITNLISNATKYASNARIDIIEGPKFAEVNIDDDGPGIPKERREEAFRPFSRLDEARSQNAPGTGLGLTLARDTARAHGGDVRLSDAPLGGLRASLRLPY